MLVGQRNEWRGINLKEFGWLAPRHCLLTIGLVSRAVLGVVVRAYYMGLHARINSLCHRKVRSPPSADSDHLTAPSLLCTACFLCENQV